MQPARGPRWHDALVERARELLPEHVLAYAVSGAREAVSLAEATDAWQAVRFSPRTLVDVRTPQTATRLLGSAVGSPVAIAPTSLQRLVHPEGEVAMARAARDTDTLLVVSSNAGATYEEIGAVGATWWLQAYLTADRSLMAGPLRRAAAAGARAIVLTVDTPVPGTKYAVDEAAFGDRSQAYGTNHSDAVRGRTPGAEHAQDLGPRDLGWITEVTGLPVVVKGVLRPDDAERAVEAGAAAIWVSNHGGRQLDRSISTARALPPVAAAVGDTVEVYVDGGIRSGLDVLAALASGADGVFLGRTPLLALADGSGGVAEVLGILDTELVEALRLAGCPTLDDTRQIVASTGP